jgi:YVTN family beta-propeller protein
VGGNDGDGHHGIQFRVLGPLQVSRDGGPLSLGGAQQRAVLAFLVTERDRAVSVDEIADALWGERPPAGYAATIQTYVFHLREVLEPERAKGDPPGVLVTEPGGYRLKIDPEAVDAADFERLIESGESFVARGLPAEGTADLRRALSLWRGSVLADLAGYEFVGRLRRRLDEVRLRAIESRIDADLALGRHASMIAELNSLAGSYPLREHLQAQRILALYRAGRQADALDAYRSVRGRLIDELGVEPGAELTNLHQLILKQDAGLQLERAAPAPPSAAAPANEPSVPAPARGVSWRLVGVSVISIVALIAAAMYAVRYSRSSSRASLPANSLVRIDADGSFHDAVGVGVSPDGVVVVGGAAWVANTSANSVSKIDLTKHVVVQTTPVGRAPQKLAVSGSDLWVVNSGAHTVSRLSLKTNQVVDTVDVGNLPGAIAVGESGIWVVNTGDDTVIRIDPATDKPDKPIAVGFRPDGIAVDANTVWVSNTGDGTVSPINAKSHVVGSSIPVGAGPAGIAVSDGSVWVANSLSQNVTRIDATRQQDTATIRVGDGPHSITRVGNRLWVANEFDGNVMVIDPTANRAVKRIATGVSVRGLVSDGKSAYATTRSLAGTGHRGGTLHITTGHLPSESGIDPSNADTASVFSAFSLVYDGLVGLRRTGGAAGLTLVPDLAVDLPRPSRNGLEYVFILRRGIHYSNGAEVRPDDIRHGLQQELTVSEDPERLAQLANIVGAPACIRIKTVCDLSKGVVTNDDTFELTFHLRGPDPDFLYKLTEPLFATPEGQPGVRAETPRPATGPYMIGRSGGTFKLVRNPHFRPWSVAAQPEGYPDEIEWIQEPDPTQAVHNVLAGKTDADERASAAADYTALLRTKPDHFHSDFTGWTSFLFLNSHNAPFNNPDVRKAINFAVDRKRIVELVGGSSYAKPTCQILPPNLPGYRRYCPYTANPTADGVYHRPDLVRAAALVHRSGTRGMPVTVTSPWDDSQSLAVARYVEAVLNRLGYKAQFALNPTDNYFSGDNPDQIGISQWLMDYPTPSSVLEGLRCGANAVGRYCNPAADKLFIRALDTQRTDPAGAGIVWASLDQTLTNDAALLNLYTHLSTIVLSDWVGNYLYNPKYGPLFGQMWVVH